MDGAAQDEDWWDLNKITQLDDLPIVQCLSLPGGVGWTMNRRSEFAFRLRLIGQM